MRGRAAKAGDTGLQPGFELPAGSVEKNAKSVYRGGAPDVVRAASGQHDGIEPRAAWRARQRCVSRRLARNNAGYVSISQHHIVSPTHRKTRSGPRPVQLVRRGPVPVAGERALDQECSATQPLLVPVYHLFTEGFDTLALKDGQPRRRNGRSERAGRKFVSLLRSN